MLSIKSILSPNPTDGINCQEVYSLWDLLASKYQFREKLHFWKNFAHDNDLVDLLNEIDNIITKTIHSLERISKKYNIPGPEVGVVDVNTSANTEAIRDELIAQDVFLWLQGVVELLLRAIRTTTTNDDVRSHFIDIIKTHLKLMDKIVPYKRNKGWINSPLLYPHIPKGVEEKLDAGEAFHLWDHLTFRYDNIHQTEIYKESSNDTELKMLLTMGIAHVLKNHVEKLENECLKFGIPLPKKPAEIIAVPTPTPSFINDDYIYRTIYIGIIGATLIHAAAVKQSLTNDRIRKYFIHLLFEEIDVQNNLIKYGKLKGYLNEAPHYNLEQPTE